MSSLRLICFLTAALLASMPALAQGPPCQPEAVGTFYLLPPLTAPPPPVRPMPSDVQDAYTAIGEIHRSTNYDSTWSTFYCLSTFDERLQEQMRIWATTDEISPHIAVVRSESLSIKP